MTALKPATNSQKSAKPYSNDSGNTGPPGLRFCRRRLNLDDTLNV
jgi:hypothetical protein